MTEMENDTPAAQMTEDASAFVDLPTLDETVTAEPLEDLAAFGAEEGPLGLEAVHEVPVKMQALLGRARMTVAELMQVAPGRVVELDRKVGEPVDIFVGNRLIARGEVVLIDKTLGVTLTEIVHEAD